jgi:hypothetical protein
MPAHYNASGELVAIDLEIPSQGGFLDIGSQGGDVLTIDADPRTPGLQQPAEGSLDQLASLFNKLLKALGAGSRVEVGPDADLDSFIETVTPIVNITLQKSAKNLSVAIARHQQAASSITPAQTSAARRLLGLPPIEPAKKDLSAPGWPAVSTETARARKLLGLPV